MSRSGRRTRIALWSSCALFCLFLVAGCASGRVVQSNGSRTWSGLGLTLKLPPGGWRIEPQGENAVLFTPQGRAGNLLIERVKTSPNEPEWLALKKLLSSFNVKKQISQRAVRLPNGESALRDRVRRPSPRRPRPPGGVPDPARRLRSTKSSSGTSAATRPPKPSWPASRPRRSPVRCRGRHETPAGLARRIAAGPARPTGRRGAAHAAPSCGGSSAGRSRSRRSSARSERIGYQSAGVVGLLGLFTGMVMVVQTGETMKRWGDGGVRQRGGGAGHPARTRAGAGRLPRRGTDRIGHRRGTRRHGRQRADRRHEVARRRPGQEARGAQGGRGHALPADAGGAGGPDRHPRRHGHGDDDAARAAGVLFQPDSARRWRSATS